MRVTLAPIYPLTRYRIQFTMAVASWGVESKIYTVCLESVCFYPVFPIIPQFSPETNHQFMSPPSVTRPQLWSLSPTQDKNGTSRKPEAKTINTPPSALKLQVIQLAPQRFYGRGALCVFRCCGGVVARTGSPCPVQRDQQGCLC